MKKCPVNRKKCPGIACRLRNSCHLWARFLVHNARGDWPFFAPFDSAELPETTRAKWDIFVASLRNAANGKTERLGFVY